MLKENVFVGNSKEKLDNIHKLCQDSRSSSVSSQEDLDSIIGSFSKKMLIDDGTGLIKRITVSDVRSSKKQFQSKQKSNSEEEDKCPICLISFDELKTIVETDPCGHRLCYDCIKIWTEKYRSICPCCRTKCDKVWPLQKSGMKLVKAIQPLKLNLDLEKWVIYQDSFYQESDDDDDVTYFCQVCKEKHTRYLMLVCDVCDDVCHTYCDPALLNTTIPEGEWYCLDCRSEKSNYNQKKQQLIIPNQQK